MLVVLQVSIEELGVARGLADGAGTGLEGVRPQEGSQAVFGQAVLTGAAQAFATACQQAAAAGGRRADGLVEGLSGSVSAFGEADQDAAQGAHALTGGPGGAGLGSVAGLAGLGAEG